MRREDAVCVCVCVCVREREREGGREGERERRGGREGERSQRSSFRLPGRWRRKISELQGLGVWGYGTKGFVISKTPIFLEHSVHPYLRPSKRA